jgi:hypothetical protein
MSKKTVAQDEMTIDQVLQAAKKPDDTEFLAKAAALRAQWAARSAMAKKKMLAKLPTAPQKGYSEDERRRQDLLSSSDEDTTEQT